MKRRRSLGGAEAEHANKAVGAAFAAQADAELAKERAKAGACRAAWLTYGRTQFGAGRADAHASGAESSSAAHDHATQAKRAAHGAFAELLASCPPRKHRGRKP